MDLPGKGVVLKAASCSKICTLLLQCCHYRSLNNLRHGHTYNPISFQRLALGPVVDNILDIPFSSLTQKHLDIDSSDHNTQIQFNGASQMSQSTEMLMLSLDKVNIRIFFCTVKF